MTKTEIDKAVEVRDMLECAWHWACVEGEGDSDRFDWINRGEDLSLWVERGVANGHAPSEVVDLLDELNINTDGVVGIIVNSICGD